MVDQDHEKVIKHHVYWVPGLVGFLGFWSLIRLHYATDFESEEFVFQKILLISIIIHVIRMTEYDGITVYCW